MKNYAFGIAALWIGVLSLGLAVVPPIALKKPLPIIGQEPEPDSVQAITDDQLASRENTLGWFSIAVGGTSFAVLVFAAISYARNEDRVFSILGIILTCIALTWKYILIGFAIAVVIIAIWIALTGIHGGRRT